PTVPVVPTIHPIASLGNPPEKLPAVARVTTVAAGRWEALEIFGQPLPIVTSVPQFLEEGSLEATQVVKPREEVVPEFRGLDDHASCIG
ncbi:MAG: hypothetical protein OXP69_06580, partial [Spirochaetaceae bacterium]|nr:hypothetical protein [Spirochaetaceae bacterium]